MTKSVLDTRRPAAWQRDWKKILLHAKEIVESYDTGVTLRQLYYQLVSDGTIPNHQSVYRQLSAKSAAARREGWFPALIDRTREIDLYDTWKSPLASFEQMVGTYRRDRTEGQKQSIYVAVEKHGMTVQLLHWFGDLGIPVLALGGYSSQTFVDVVANHVARQSRPSVLLYAGDFDATGVDIDRDFTERTEIFDEVIRVALREEQVAEYDLPPMPGKHSDPRSARFMLKHGELVQVELDALKPEKLKELYQEEIDKLFDKKQWEKVVKRETREREVLNSMHELVQYDNSVDRAVHLVERMGMNRDDISAVLDAGHDAYFEADS